MKILIVQIGRYGDMILTTPMFREIHRAHPTAEIHVLASHRNYHIIKHHPRVKKVWVYSKKIGSILTLLYALRKEQFDVWIDPKDHASRESSLLATLSGATSKIGYNGQTGRAFTQPIPSQYPAEFHQTQINCAALMMLGIEAENVLPELYVDENSEHYIRQYVQHATPYVVVNLSAGNESRALPFEMWNAICAAISHPIFLNYTAPDALLAEKLEGGNSLVHRVASRTILDAVSLIRHAQLLISPDTAAIHIASAFDVPTIGFYPAIDWNYYKFRPLSSQCAVLRPDASSQSISDIPLDKIRTTLEQFTF